MLLTLSWNLPIRIPISVKSLFVGNIDNLFHVNTLFHIYFILYSILNERENLYIAIYPICSYLKMYIDTNLTSYHQFLSLSTYFMLSLFTLPSPECFPLTYDRSTSKSKYDFGQLNLLKVSLIFFQKVWAFFYSLH